MSEPARGRGAQGRGRGRGNGRGGGRGRGRFQGAVQGKIDDPPVEPKLPTFCTIADLKQSNRTYDLVVKVSNVALEATHTEERRGGRSITTTCSEALVGDSSGCIKLSTRNPEVSALKDGTYIVLINVKLRRVGALSWLEVDNWSAMKPAAACAELLPADFKLDFEINLESDRSKRTTPKPTFTKVDAVEPDTKGIYLVVKVLSLSKAGKAAVAKIGDESGSMMMTARGPQYDKVLIEGSVVVIFNARVDMHEDKYMRLVVDRWSDMKPLEEAEAELLPLDHFTAESVVKADNDKSGVEYCKQ